MLVVGKVGWGNPHPTKLTPNEQVTHITLWSLLSAPLLIGCDMSQLDPFTTALLGNDEVLAVDQDPLGKPAGRKAKDGQLEVWARPLSDGTTAVGLFNRGSAPAEVTAHWTDLGLSGEQPVRDLWQQKDLGSIKTPSRPPCRATGRCWSRSASRWRSRKSSSFPGSAWGTHCSGGSASRADKTRGRASQAGRSQALPGNEEP